MTDKWFMINTGSDWKQTVYSWGIGQIHETPNLHYDPPTQYHGTFFMAQDIDSKLWYHGSFQNGSLNLWLSHESYQADTGEEAARQYFIYHLSQQRKRLVDELTKLNARIQELSPSKPTEPADAGSEVNSPPRYPQCLTSIGRSGSGEAKTGGHVGREVKSGQ